MIGLLKKLALARLRGQLSICEVACWLTCTGPPIAEGRPVAAARELLQWVFALGIQVACLKVPSVTTFVDLWGVEWVDWLIS